MRARAHDIVDIESCPLFAPGLAGAVAAARALAADLRGAASRSTSGERRRSAGSTSTCAARARSTRAMRRKAVATAERLDLARVANHGEVVVERRPPQIAFGAVMAVPRPAAFSRRPKRASRRSPTARRRAQGARRVADLFCGAGAFALRLARRSRGLRRRRRRCGGRGAAPRRRRRGAASGLSAEVRDLSAGR